MLLHTSVLLREAIEFLQPKDGGRYLDGTVGFGGHSEAILEAASTELLGLDRDTAALELAEKRLARFGNRAALRHNCFSEFSEEMQSLGWDKLDGAILDLGVSSMQIDSAERGFSFLSDGPLDMRMDQYGLAEDDAESAFSFVNTLSEAALKKIIAEYGEDPMAASIARAIVSQRGSGIKTTKELAEIVERAYPVSWRAKARRHPATRTFQALRMIVNNELGELEEFLKIIPNYLAKGARLVIISFHSLEDRMVKHAFRAEAEECVCPKFLPECVCTKEATFKIITKKPVLPREDEIDTNIRAGSAKMRVAEKR